MKTLSCIIVVCLYIFFWYASWSYTSLFCYSFFVIIDGKVSVWVGGHDNPVYHTDKDSAVRFVKERTTFGKAINSLGKVCKA